MGKVVWTALVALVAFWLMMARDEFDWDSLSGKRVLLTGASSGIGEEMAYKYCQHGARLVITARREKLLQEVSAKCRQLSDGKGSIDYIVADMARQEDLEPLIERTLALLGGLDMLVLNHAVMPDARFFSHDILQQDTYIMNVNYHSMVTLTSHALPHIQASKGLISVTGSGAGRLPTPGLASYVAAKYALDGFFSTLRIELALVDPSVSVTYCVIGRIGTERGNEVVSSLTSKIGLSLAMLDAVAPAHSPADTGAAIVAAAASRQKELYYPGNQGLYLQAVLTKLFPVMIEKSYSQFVGDKVKK